VGDAALRFALAPDAAPQRLPAIGLGAASHGAPLSAREIALLRVLRPAHLRVDLDIAGDYRSRLAQAAGEAQALGARLEAAVFCSAAAERELAALAAVVADVRPPVAAWLIFDTAQKVTPPALVDAAREALGAYDPAATFAGGTNAYFTELNRGRPQLDTAIAVCYSLNPQVHAFDNTSLVETLEAQGVTVASAKALYGARPIRVSPVTLRPRFNPNATGPAIETPGELPATVDRRQPSLFGAAWTLGSIKYLAESGAASVTLFETTGWRGVVERATGSPEPALFHSIPGAVFPLYHVLADVAEYVGGNVLPSRSSDPLALDGIVLQQGERRTLIIANLRQETQQARIAVAGRHVRVRYLDETTMHSAMTDPEAYRAQPGAAVATPDGVLMITLRPYAVARIDAESR
jgi:hypothetical protein